MTPPTIGERLAEIKPSRMITPTNANITPTTSSLRSGESLFHHVVSRCAGVYVGSAGWGDTGGGGDFCFAMPLACESAPPFFGEDFLPAAGFLFFEPKGVRRGIRFTICAICE